jgi:23S rRNA (adenine2503-C2)-methyltransferase
VRDLEAVGYQVILSIGEVEENLIGSNCGQFVVRHISRPWEIAGGYTYEVERDEILDI